MDLKDCYCSLCGKFYNSRHKCKKKKKSVNDEKHLDFEESFKVQSMEKEDFSSMEETYSPIIETDESSFFDFSQEKEDDDQNTKNAILLRNEIQKDPEEGISKYFKNFNCKANLCDEFMKDTKNIMIKIENHLKKSNIHFFQPDWSNIETERGRRRKKLFKYEISDVYSETVHKNGKFGEIYMLKLKDILKVALTKKFYDQFVKNIQNNISNDGKVRDFLDGDLVRNNYYFKHYSNSSIFTALYLDEKEVFGEDRVFVYLVLLSLPSVFRLQFDNIFLLGCFNGQFLKELGYSTCMKPIINQFYPYHSKDGVKTVIENQIVIPNLHVILICVLGDNPIQNSAMGKSKDFKRKTSKILRYTNDTIADDPYRNDVKFLEKNEAQEIYNLDFSSTQKHQQIFALKEYPELMFVPFFDIIWGIINDRFHGEEEGLMKTEWIETTKACVLSNLFTIEDYNVAFKSFLKIHHLNGIQGNIDEDRLFLSKKTIKGKTDTISFKGFDCLIHLQFLMIFISKNITKKKNPKNIWNLQFLIRIKLHLHYHSLDTSFQSFNFIEKSYEIAKKHYYLWKETKLKETAKLCFGGYKKKFHQMWGPSIDLHTYMLESALGVMNRRNFGKWKVEMSLMRIGLRNLSPISLKFPKVKVIISAESIELDELEDDVFLPNNIFRVNECSKLILKGRPVLISYLVTRNDLKVFQIKQILQDSDSGQIFIFGINVDISERCKHTSFRIIEELDDHETFLLEDVVEINCIEPLECCKCNCVFNTFRITLK